MAFLDDINETLRKRFVREALGYLNSPSLRDVLGDKPKWDILKISTSGFVVKHKETGEISFCALPL